MKKTLIEREHFFRRHMKAAQFGSQRCSGPAVHGQGLGSPLVGTLTTGLSLEAAEAFDLEKEANVTTSVPGLQAVTSLKAPFFQVKATSL